MIQWAYGAIGWPHPMSYVAVRIARLGYQGLEGFGLLDLLPQDQMLAFTLHSCKLKFVGSYFSASLVQPDRLQDELDDFRATCQKIRGLGGNKVAVGVGRTLDDVDKNILWDRLLKSLEKMAEVAVQENVDFCLHPHQGNLVYTYEETKRVIENTPKSVRLTLDTAHVHAAGCNVVQVFEEFYPRLGHVHLKDYRDETFLPLGEGEVALGDVLSFLQRANYSGWATVELDAAREPEVCAKRSMEFLRKHWK